MDDALAMRTVERAGDLAGDAERLVHAHRRARAARRASRPRGTPSRGSRRLGLPDIVEHADVWMIERRDRTRLPLESLAHLRVRPPGSLRAP